MPPVLRSFAEMDCTTLLATSLIMRSIARPTVLSGLEDRQSRAGGLAALEAHFGVGVEGERAHRSPPCKTPSPEPYCRRQAASGQLLAGGWRCRCVVGGLGRQSAGFCASTAAHWPYPECRPRTRSARSARGCGGGWFPPQHSGDRDSGRYRCQRKFN